MTGIQTLLKEGLESQNCHDVIIICNVYDAHHEPAVPIHSYSKFVTSYILPISQQNTVQEICMLKHRLIETCQQHPITHAIKL